MGDQQSLMLSLEKVLGRNWLTNDGPMVRELEERLADHLKVDHCIAVSNGTMGLELAIRAMGLSGEVIVPSFTFIATAHALRMNGIRPVFCDIDETSMCLDPDKVESLINGKTTGILGVHIYGRACDTIRFDAIARKHNLAIIYDAAHAFSCTHQGRPIGAFGDCEVFSFHATKVFNSLEGGAITTQNAALADRLRRLRNFGFTGDGREETVECGTNAKMNEFCAAVGLNNLSSIDEFIKTNRDVHQLYNEHLSDIPGINLVRQPDEDASNYQYVIALVDEAIYGASRDELVSELVQQGVLARKYFAPGCHAMQPYASDDPFVKERLPVTLQLTEQTLALPTGTQMTPTLVASIADFIRKFPDKDSTLAQIVV